MSEIDEVKTALALVGKLTDRAIKVCSGIPYFHYVPNPETAKISIRDDVVVLEHWDDATEYNASYLEKEEHSFPAELLLMSDDDFHTWEESQREIYDTKEAERKSMEAAQKEKQERAVYEALKRKFEKA